MNKRVHLLQKGAIPMGRWFQGVVCAVTAAALCATTTVALDGFGLIDTDEPYKGLEVSSYEGSASGGDQQLYTVVADGKRFAPVIGGVQGQRELIGDMAPVTGGGEVVAAINGDHFSFQTGVPMGMSVSDGEIIASPVAAYDADEYFFHTLGITADGEVLVGENPRLFMQYTVDEETVTLDRINRTRTQWEGEMVCLFTPAYGESTGTGRTGVEYIIRVSEGEVRAGSTLKGVIEKRSTDNDSPIEEGTVVLSLDIKQFDENERLKEGDEIEFYFSFEDERWNDVVFAVGGNMTIVDEGEPVTYDYDVSAFADPQPRSALGVRKNGDLVLAVADGRSETAAGLTANEMAAYMADEMACEYAILLDGGGSTALGVADDGGAMQTVNTPSEERPVGNGVLLVATGKNGIDATWWLLGGAVVLAVAAVVGAVLYKPHGKNDQEKPTDEPTA